MNNEGPVRWVPKTAFVMPLLPPFLELSGDDSVDPDWAIEAMEHIATYLLRLPTTEVAVVARQLAAVSEYARTQGAPSGFIEFVDGFLDNCGVSRGDPA